MGCKEVKLNKITKEEYIDNALYNLNKESVKAIKEQIYVWNNNDRKLLKEIKEIIEDREDKEKEILKTKFKIIEED